MEANAAKRMELRKLAQEHMRRFKEEQKYIEMVQVKAQHDSYEEIRREQLEQTARYWAKVKPKDIEIRLVR